MRATWFVETIRREFYSRDFDLGQHLCLLVQQIIRSLNPVNNFFVKPFTRYANMISSRNQLFGYIRFCRFLISCDILVTLNQFYVEPAARSVFVRSVAITFVLVNFGGGGGRAWTILKNINKGITNKNINKKITS